MRDQRGLTWAWFSDGFLWVVLFNITQNWTLEKSWGRDQAGCWYGSAFVVAKAVTYTNILVIWIDEQIPERKTVRRPLYQDNDQSDVPSQIVNATHAQVSFIYLQLWPLGKAANAGQESILHFHTYLPPRSLWLEKNNLVRWEIERKAQSRFWWIQNSWSKRLSCRSIHTGCVTHRRLWGWVANRSRFIEAKKTDLALGAKWTVRILSIAAGCDIIKS